MSDVLVKIKYKGRSRILPVDEFLLELDKAGILYHLNLDGSVVSILLDEYGDYEDVQVEKL